MSFLNIWLDECRLLAINHACHVTLKVENTGSQVFDCMRAHQALGKDAVSTRRAKGTTGLTMIALRVLSRSSCEMKTSHHVSVACAKSELINMTLAQYLAMLRASC